VLRWLTLAVAALGGGVLCLLLAARGPQAAWSYVGGLGLAVLVLEVSLFNVRYVERWMPRLTMLAAMASYVMAAILLALALAASSARIVVPEAVSAGLVAGVLIELGYLIGRSWVRAERDLPPVRLSMHDDRSTST
jgi:hypothetical protein